MKCNGIREGFRPGLPPFIKQANQHFAFWSFFTLKSLLMTVFVYALKNQINDEIYVGISADLDRRLKEHNSGKNRYTKAFLPWTLFLLNHATFMRKRGNVKSIINLRRVNGN
jgi:predicted GIY-YIG superfamily endonuclease